MFSAALLHWFHTSRNADTRVLFGIIFLLFQITVSVAVCVIDLNWISVRAFGFFLIRVYFHITCFFMFSAALLCWFHTCRNADTRVCFSIIFLLFQITVSASVCVIDLNWISVRAFGSFVIRVYFHITCFFMFSAALLHWFHTCRNADTRVCFSIIFLLFQITVSVAVYVIAFGVKLHQSRNHRMIHYTLGWSPIFIIFIFIGDFLRHWIRWKYCRIATCLCRRQKFWTRRTTINRATCNIPRERRTKRKRRWRKVWNVGLGKRFQSWGHCTWN